MIISDFFNEILWYKILNIINSIVLKRFGIRFIEIIIFKKDRIKKPFLSQESFKSKQKILN